jgi:hypothetical protein
MCSPGFGRGHCLPGRVASAEDRPGGEFLNDHDFKKMAAMLGLFEEGNVANAIKEVKGESIVREMSYDSRLIRGILLHRRDGSTLAIKPDGAAKVLATPRPASCALC